MTVNERSHTTTITDTVILSLFGCHWQTTGDLRQHSAPAFCVAKYGIAYKKDQLLHDQQHR